MNWLDELMDIWEGRKPFPEQRDIFDPVNGKCIKIDFKAYTDEYIYEDGYIERVYIGD